MQNKQREKGYYWCQPKGFDKTAPLRFNGYGWELPGIGIGYSDEAMLTINETRILSPDDETVFNMEKLSDTTDERYINSVVGSLIHQIATIQEQIRYAKSRIPGSNRAKPFIDEDATDAPLDNFESFARRSSFSVPPIPDPASGTRAFPDTTNEPEPPPINRVSAFINRMMGGAKREWK